MLMILTGIAATAAFGALAARFGAEQRPDFIERPEALQPHSHGLR